MIFDNNTFNVIIRNCQRCPRKRRYVQESTWSSNIPERSRGSAPYKILTNVNSDAGSLATLYYTNAVPQVANFNMGSWKKYEGRIVKYAQRRCAPNGGTLYLITGISEVIISQAGNPPTVQATGKPMSQSFPSQVAPQKIAIPNSMWTAGCCVKGTGPFASVLGAFAVIGNNLPEQSGYNNLMPQGVSHNTVFTNLGVTKVQDFIKTGANDQTIKLFPGNDDCYDPNKQYDLSIKLPI